MTRWIRGHKWMVATAVVVIGSLAAVDAIVLLMVDRENDVREAETALARTEPYAGALVMQPREMLRGAPSRQQISVNRGIRDRLEDRVTKLAGSLPDAEASALRAATARSIAADDRLIALLRDDHLAAARTVYGRSLAPAVREVQRVLESAGRNLGREADRAHTQAIVATVAITGVVGGLLVMLMFGVVAARRLRERAETEERVVRESEAKLVALLQHSSDMVTVVSRDGTVVYQAGAVQATLGFPPEKLLGANLRNWVHPDDLPTLESIYEAADGQGHELRLRHRDGSLRICEARGTSLLHHARWGGIVLNIRDVSERKALEERLRHRAFHDGLTGLPNREQFAFHLDRALRQGARSGRDVVVMLVDLDNFKAINDTHGHAAGDAVLVATAARLTNTLRLTDSVARLGGDEFVVVLDPGPEPLDECEVAARLLAALAEPLRLDGHSLRISASIGIVRSGSATPSADELVREADRAMYRAKTDGKGTYADVTMP